VAHQRGFQPRVRTQRRKTAWGVGPNATAQASTAALNPIAWANGVVLQNDSEATIVRIRGIMSLVLHVSSLAAGGFLGAAGIGITTAAAFAAGVGSMPSPITELDWDGWMWHHFYDVHSVTATIADGANAGAVYQRVLIDSKAMRKFRTDEVVFGIWENAEEIGTATVTIHANSRMLFMLP